MILNYIERIRFSYPTHIMSLVDFIVINTETLMIDSEWSLEKEFIKLISMNR